MNRLIAPKARATNGTPQVNHASFDMPLLLAHEQA
jgi:hypothetical protein